MSGAVEWRLRRPEYALGLNGEDAKISTDFGAIGGAGESFTVVVWHRAEAFEASANYALATNYPGSGHDGFYMLGTDDGDGMFWWLRDESKAYSEQTSKYGPAFDGEAHMYTAIRNADAGSMRFLIDTDQKEERSFPGDVAVRDSDSVLSIGEHSSRYIPGTVDEIRVYGRALSDSEIGTLNSGGDVEDGLLLRYALDEGSGGVATDSAGDSDGQIMGGATWEDPLVLTTIDDRLVDVEDVTLAYNRFARSATAVLDDPDGDVPGEYPKPDRVALDVKRRVDDSWTRRFGGFVSGYDTDRNRTKLELLSHDHWIRSRDVNRDFVDVARSDVLRELVEDLTPLEWNPDLVDVYDDSTVTRKWRGEQLDQAIESLAKGSNDEYFGATGDMQFFFLQPSTTDADRDFVPGQYYNADFEEDGKYELNEVTINYGGDPANQAVIVEDRARQRELGDGLGVDRNVVLSDSKTYTSIDTEAEARERGREILEGATPVQTGTIETWDGFDVEPGDVVFVDVPDQQVSGEFRVAEIVHKGWVDDKTEITLAENSDGVIDTLVELSDEVDRLDARAASDDKTITRFTDLGLEFGVELELTATKRTIDPDQFSFGEPREGFGDGRGILGDRRDEPEEIDL